MRPRTSNIFAPHVEIGGHFCWGQKAVVCCAHVAGFDLRLWKGAEIDKVKIPKPSYECNSERSELLVCQCLNKKVRQFTL